MRQWSGLVNTADVEDKLARKSLHAIDIYLRQLSAAGFPSGQPTATGAQGGSNSACCTNQVDEFERVNDSTEGILNFGRAEALAAVPPSAAHNIVRIEGWEYNFQTGTLMGGDQSSGAGVSTVTSPHHGSGTYALQIAYSAVATNFVDLGIGFASTGRSSTAARTTVGYRVWIYITSLPAASAKIFSLISGATERSILQLSSTGHLILDGITGPSTLAVATWYEITGKYNSASTGRVDVQIASDSLVRTVEFSNVTPTSNGTVTILRLGVNGSNQAWTCGYDDVCLEADATTLDYPPAGEVRAMALTADGAIADVWAITGAATRWEACNNPHDGDTSYIAVSNVGVRRQTFIQALPSSIDQTINAAQFNNVMRQTPGSGGACRIVIAPNNTSTVGDLTEIATDTATTVFGLRAACRQTNPFTSATWTHSALEAMVIGCYSNPNGAAEAHRQSTVITTIDVGADVPGDFARAIRVTAAEGYTIPAYLVADGEALDTNDRARLIAGTDGTSAQIILVDTSGRLVVTLVPGSGATDLGKAEDAVHTSGDIGVMALAVRDDDPPVATAAVGDYTPLLTDDIGRLWVNTELPNAAVLGDTDTNPTTPIIGALVKFRNEGTTTNSRASGETHATDELGNTDDAGIHTSEIHKSFTVSLTDLNTAYDSAGEAHTSVVTDCRRFEYAILSFTLDSTGTPTDMIVDVETSPDNAHWSKPGDGFLQDLRYDDTVCATAIDEWVKIEKLDRFLRVTMTSAGGTGVGTKFDVTNAKITFFN